MHIIVHSGGILNFVMVQCIERNACRILVHDTKNCVQWVLIQEPKLCVVDIDALHKSARKLLARQKVIHNGFKVHEARFTL
jgi:hypothetical protein